MPFISELKVFAIDSKNNWKISWTKQKKPIYHIVIFPSKSASIRNCLLKTIQTKSVELRRIWLVVNIQWK
jgi:hypothetical protein